MHGIPRLCKCREFYENLYFKFYYPILTSFKLVLFLFVNNSCIINSSSILIILINCDSSININFFLYEFFVFIDTEENSPEDIVIEWHLEIRRFFSSYSAASGEIKLVTIMKEYIT